MIGDAALKTVPRGGDKLPKELKESMPKDAYAMWNKLQKSIIGTASGSEMLECSECGECISVCPVGALVSSDFIYKSNAWELKKIPAANPHSSDCELIYYEVKHISIKDPSEMIYRVTNEQHYGTLNGAARWGFDFENRVASKDKAAFDKAVDILKNKADTIKFNSFITNEEALILQKLKEKLGVKLVNKDASDYKRFLQNFSEVAGESLYNGTLKQDVMKSNFVISVGSNLRSDSPNSSYAMNNALKINKGSGIYFHTIDDDIVRTFAKNIEVAVHEVGAEESVMALILKLFAKDLPSDIAKKLDKLDNEKLYKTCGLEDGFEERLQKLLAKKDSYSLILGPDLYSHPRAKNIAHLAGLIQKYTDFKVVIIPTNTNTLGVSLICDLDDECGEYVVGYNEDGDFKLSALGDGDLDMPALNQQEGTFTNIDKRVVPTNVALPYSGYVLNDIANALGLESEYTIDYTKELPINKGYKAIEFDDLENYYTNAGEERRGYKLEISKVESKDKFEDIAEIESYDGTIIYECNPILQFSEFTAKCHELKDDFKLIGSKQYSIAAKISDGDRVKVSFGDYEKEMIYKEDEDLKGTIALLPACDGSIRLGENFRYTKAKIIQVG
jgi:NADH-quinone oxidoreductase subunit G